MSICGVPRHADQRGMQPELRDYMCEARVRALMDIHSPALYYYCDTRVLKGERGDCDTEAEVYSEFTTFSSSIPYYLLQEAFRHETSHSVFLIILSCLRLKYHTLIHGDALQQGCYDCISIGQGNTFYASGGFRLHPRMTTALFFTNENEPVSISRLHPWYHDVDLSVSARILFNSFEPFTHDPYHNHHTTLAATTYTLRHVQPRPLLLNLHLAFCDGQPPNIVYIVPPTTSEDIFSNIASG